MTGIRNDAPPQVVEVDMGPLVMTGIRNDAPPQVVEVDMGPLVMTGIRNDASPQVVEVNLGPLVMTGIRNNAPPQILDIAMGPLIMTGIRNDAPPQVVEVNLGPLVMTGIRTGQPAPPVEGEKTKIKTKVQEGLEKKLDLPFKKPEPVKGANPPAGQPDPVQMKQGGTGNAVGDTAANRILGKIPSMTKPSVPEKPADGSAKTQLQQPSGIKKSIDDAIQPGKIAPVNPSAGKN
jgi:hypothetical protein